MRLIDADAMCADLATVDPRYKAMIEWGVRVTEAQPTVDAVEVVRCKDCVYCKRFNDVWYLPKKDELLCTRCVEAYHTTENDYCSWAERRKDGNEPKSV